MKDVNIMIIPLKYVISCDIFGCEGKFLKDMSF